jgi:hypothetical protein
MHWWDISDQLKAELSGNAISYCMDVDSGSMAYPAVMHNAHGTRDLVPVNLVFRNMTCLVPISLD